MVGRHVVDGVFAPTERDAARLELGLDELAALAPALAVLREPAALAV